MTKKEYFYPIRLKILRSVMGLTVTELANKLECSKQLVSHWETGNRKPTKPYMIMLCNVFDVSESFFRNNLVTIAVKENDIIINYLHDKERTNREV